MLISSATVNPILTATLTRFIQDVGGFVGTRIAPLFLTGQQAAKYYVFDKSNNLDVPKDLQRAPSTPYKRTQLRLSDDSYSASNKGIEIPVDDEERAKYAAAFSADEAAMRRARNIIVVNHEIRVKDLVTSNVVASASPTAKWDTYTGTVGEPVADVDVAKDIIHASTGLEANLMILPRIVFNKLKEHPAILSRIQYSQRGIVTKEILQEIFGIPEIIIAGVMDNAAADGQTPNPAYIWGDSVLLLHSETSSDLQAPNLARTFVWTAQTGPDGVMVETYREDNIQSDIHRAKQYTDEKVVGADLGYHLSNVLAT